MNEKEYLEDFFWDMDSPLGGDYNPFEEFDNFLDDMDYLDEYIYEMGMKEQKKKDGPLFYLDGQPIYEMGKDEMW